jgi:X-Pro dipeptidyl-peptidase
MSQMQSARRTSLVVALAALVAALAAGPAGAAEPPSIVVENGVTQPVFSYAQAIRELVWVESQVDSDNDGRLDRIAVEIMRPRETAEGMKVATVMEASPYYGRSFPGGGEVPPPPEDEVTVVRPTPEVDEGEEGPRGFPRWYDDYFVPRGYAMVEVEMVGTSRSEGCPTIGDHAETASIVAAIDWLNGRARAWYEDGSPAVADWSTGAVGMSGVSYNGTLPNAAAVEGTPGLKTIVPIAAISSWYDYARDHGIAFSGWANRYTVFLADYVSVGRTIPGANAACAAHIQQLGDLGDDATDDYTPFWQERNYRPNANKIKTEKTSVFMVHGLEDWNVKRAHFSRLWYEVEKRQMARKLWLHRGGHSDPNSVRQAEWRRQLHRWMDHWLYGIQNGIVDEPMVDIQRPNGAWETHSTWPAAGTQRVDLRLGAAGHGAPGTLTFEQVPGATTARLGDNWSQQEPAMIASAHESRPNRLVFVTPPLAQDVRISGTPSVRVRFAPTTDSVPLTALLVDYGQTVATVLSDQTPLELLSEPCDEINIREQTGCAEPPEETVIITPQVIVSRGSIDGKNHVDLRRSDWLLPGEPVWAQWELQPHDYVFPAGHRIGLVLVTNHRSHIRRDLRSGPVDVYLGQSRLTLPVVGGKTALGG